MHVPHSSHWGAFTARTESGRLVGVHPFAADEDPSPLLASMPDALYSPARVRRPAVRRGWLDKKPRTETRRGADEWVELDWDDALDLVAAELERVRTTFGNEALYGGSYGWASAGGFHHARTQLHRFLSCIGGYTGSEGTYSFAAASTILPHVLGRDVVLEGMSSWEVLRDGTELWVMFGGAPARNMQVESGGLAVHRARLGLQAVVDSGASIVNVNPIRCDAPSAPNVRWLPIRPNTDTALMLALAHVLLTENRYDEEFVARHTVGFDRFVPYLLGETDGCPKTPDWAAAITGIDSEAVRDLAREMAQRRTLLTATWSLQRADHGEQPFWMTVVLAAMLGQIGLPGGGFGFGYGSVGGEGTPRVPFAVPRLRAPTNPVRTAIPVARIAEMLERPGETYDFNGERRTYPHVELVYWAGGSPFHHHQDLNRLVDAWQRPDTVIVHEPWWTPTARHADIVLPTTTTLERDDIGAAAKDRHVLAMHRAVEPIGDARDDYDIFSALATRLSVQNAFTEGRSTTEWLRHLYDEGAASALAHGIELPDFETFWRRGHAELPPVAPKVLLSELRAGTPLATPSGRIEIHSERIASFGYDDCPGHPMWLEPTEWLGAAAVARFPLHLVSIQPRTRLHSQMDMGRVSEGSKVAGREPCRLNPRDADQRGIVDGSIVRLYNDRGSCLAGAVLSDDVREGVVVLATGAWYDPVDPSRHGSLDKHGNPNVLTADRGTSRLSQGPSAHSALVEVEPWLGEAPTVAVFAPPVTASG